MKYPSIPLSWKLEETLQLLKFVETESDWSKNAKNIMDIFGSERPANFFTEKTCKDEFERIMSSGHPEHFLRQQGEKYSQKELIHAWIIYLQKQFEIKKAREGELLLIKLREKANLFNRICADNCDLTDDEIKRLLEEAREEDSKRDPEIVNRELEIGLQKLKELQILHETNPEKYPALKIIIPPSHPSESSTNAAPFSPIKPLFEGLTPPSQMISRFKAAAAAAAAATAASNVSAPQSPSKQEISSSKNEQSVTNPSEETSSVETAIEASELIEKLPTMQIRLPTLSTDSNIFTCSSSQQLEVSRNDSLRAKSTAGADEIAESVTINEGKLRLVEVKNECIDEEQASTAVEEVIEKKETVRTRRIHKASASARQSGLEIGTNEKTEATVMPHGHSLKTRRSQAASASGAADKRTEEEGTGEQGEEKLRRSERCHMKGESENAKSTVVSAQTGRRKRALRMETTANDEEVKKAIPPKRRRLSNKDFDVVGKTQQIESTIEVQSSPEPEKEKDKRGVTQESVDEKGSVETRKRGRLLRGAATNAGEEKAKEKKGTTPETSTRSSRKTSTTTRTTRRQSKRAGSSESDVEQKALMVTAWRMISSHRHAAIFAHPVSDRDARGYSKTVKRRMDLSTLKKQLDSGNMEGMKDFKRKILLMFANAVMFNSTGHDVNQYAKEMTVDSLNSLKTLQKDVLFAPGTTHMTRRSAAFAAEEAKFERSRFSTPRTNVASSEEPAKEKTSENISRETSENPKTSRVGKSAKD